MASTSDVTSGGTQLPLGGQTEGKKAPTEKENILGERKVSQKSSEEVSPKIPRRVSAPYTPKTSSPLAQSHDVSHGAATSRKMAVSPQVTRKLTGERTASPLHRAVVEQARAEERAKLTAEKIVAIANKADNAAGREITKLFLVSKDLGALVSNQSDPLLMKWALAAAEKQLTPGTTPHTVFKMAELLSNKIVEMHSFASNNNAGQIIAQLSDSRHNVQGFNNQAFQMLAHYAENSSSGTVKNTIAQVRTELVLQEIDQSPDDEIEQVIINGLQGALEHNASQLITKILLVAQDRVGTQKVGELFNQVVSEANHLDESSTQEAHEAFYAFEIAATFQSGNGVEELAKLFMQKGLEPGFQKALEKTIKDSPPNARTREFVQESLALAIQQNPDRQRVLELVLVFTKAAKDQKATQKLLEGYPSPTLILQKLQDIKSSVKDTFAMQESLIALLSKVVEKGDGKTARAICELARNDQFTDDLLNTFIDQLTSKRAAPALVFMTSIALQTQLSHEYEDIRKNQSQMDELRVQLKDAQKAGILPEILKDEKLRQGLLAKIERQPPNIRSSFDSLKTALTHDVRVVEMQKHLQANNFTEAGVQLAKCYGTASFAPALKLMRALPKETQEKVFSAMEHEAAIAQPRSSVYLQELADDMATYSQQHQGDVMVVNSGDFLRLEQVLCSRESKLKEKLGDLGYPLFRQVIQGNAAQRMAAFKQLSNEEKQQLLGEIREVAGGHPAVRSLLERTPDESCQRLATMLDDAFVQEGLRKGATKAAKLRFFPAFLDKDLKSRQEFIGKLSNDDKNDLLNEMEKVVKKAEVKDLAGHIRDQLYSLTEEERFSRLQSILGDDGHMQTLSGPIQTMLHARDFPLARELAALNDTQLKAKLEAMELRDYALLLRELVRLQ